MNVVASSPPFARGDIVSALRTWMAEQSLPLWASRGWDERRGGFVDRLGVDGVPDPAAPRRTFVQARQIYAFATAAERGWLPEGLALAERGLAHLLATAKSPDGQPGFVSRLAADGTIVDATRDTYDHTFVLLALATLYRVKPDAQVRAEIDQVLAFMDRDLRGFMGGLAEAQPKRLPRRQNPQLHGFEAMIALYQATGEEIFQTRAGDLYSIFVRYLFDPDIKMVGEFYDERWNPIEPVVVEPGHQAEWVWLLKAFERVTGCPTARPRGALFDAALRFRDAGSGCLVDEADGAGAIVRTTRRLWPQTEMAKAWIAQAESGVEGAGEGARLALRRMAQHYLTHPVAGGWYDQFDADNRSLVETIPASSLYHVLGTIVEAERVLGAY